MLRLILLLSSLSHRVLTMVIYRTRQMIRGGSRSATKGLLVHDKLISISSLCKEEFAAAERRRRRSSTYVAGPFVDDSLLRGSY